MLQSDWRGTLLPDAQCQVLSDRNLPDFVMQTWYGNKIQIGVDDNKATTHNHSDIFLHDISLEEETALCWKWQPWWWAMILVMMLFVSCGWIGTSVPCMAKRGGVSGWKQMLCLQFSEAIQVQCSRPNCKIASTPSAVPARFHHTPYEYQSLFWLYLVLYTTHMHIKVFLSPWSEPCFITLLLQRYRPGVLKRAFCISYSQEKIKWRNCSQYKSGFLICLGLFVIL